MQTTQTEKQQNYDQGFILIMQLSGLGLLLTFAAACNTYCIDYLARANYG